MRFGLCLPNNQGVRRVRDLVDLAVAAEQLGFHSVWVSEHLFHAAYVAERLGSAPYHEALTTLTAVAAATKRVRLGTSVLVLPWHHPVRLAKAIASLDDLSDGRVNLGVGVAVTADEYANLGVSFASRGALADEIIDALRTLWTESFPSFNGRHYRFEGLRFEPKPRQQPLPLYIGGSSPAALTRLARRGDAWHPLGLSLTELRQQLTTAQVDPARTPVAPRMLLQFLDAPSERPLDSRRTLRGTPAELQTLLQGFADAGIGEMVLDPATGDLQAYRETMHRARDAFSQLPGAWLT